MASFEGKLLPGETIVWTGQPGQGLLIRPIEMFMIPFSLLWGGFAIFWNISVWSSDAPIMMKLFGLPFLLIGIFIIFGRFWVDNQARRHTYYAITNHRILIARHMLFPSFKSVDLKRLPSLELIEHSDHEGTIRFGPSFSLFSGNGFGAWLPAFEAVPQFLKIERAHDVYALIQRETH